MALSHFANLIEQHNDELLVLETWDNVKPYDKAINIEVPMVPRLMRYFVNISIDIVHFLLYKF